jgi:pilus assembly protein CpaB
VTECDGDQSVEIVTCAATPLLSAVKDRKGNLMRKGGRVFILLGVVLALAAAVLAIIAFSDTSEDEEVAEPEPEMVEVIEAASDIPVNHVITEDDITVVEVEEDTVSPGTARSTGQVLGLAASGDIVNGQRVLMANLVTPGLSHIVDDGMRAVAIPIDRVNALGGMIRAEDRIDLVYSISFEVADFFEALRDQLEDQPPPPAEEGEEGEEPEQPSGIPGFPDLEGLPMPFEPGSLVRVTLPDESEPVTKLLLQNIRVVRVVAGDITVDDDGRAVPVNDNANATVDDDADDEEDDSNDSATPDTSPQEPERLPSADMIIIEVDPFMAELVTFILDYEGQFQVALRGPDDQDIVETPGMTFRQMVEQHGLPLPRPAEVPEDPEIEDDAEDGDDDEDEEQ